MTTPYCLICHNIYSQTEEIASTPCGHVYHDECLIDWLKTSETCPKCRTNCSSTQIKRIYIDFACDEQLAIAQASKENKKSENSDADNEEMIKILLEHIENGSNEEHKHKQKQLQSSDGCDLCIVFQEAYERTLMEKEQIEQVLISIERENQKSADSKQQTVNIIDNNEVQIQATDTKQFEQKQNKEETPQPDDATPQSDNLSN